MLQLVPLLFAALVLIAAYPFVRKRVKQRSLKNVPGPAPASFVGGLSKQMHSPSSVPLRERVLVSYGRAIKIPMVLGDVDLAVSDPLALSTMFGKYRDVYDNPEWFSETMNAVFGPGLSSVRGKEHAQQRKQLNPAFAVRYLRDMVPMFCRIGAEVRQSRPMTPRHLHPPPYLQLVTVLRNKVVAPRTEVDVAQYFSRYSLECIGRTGLGYSFGSLDHHGTDYSRALKEFGPTITKFHVLRRLLPWLRRTFPRSWLRRATEVLPWAPLRHIRGISDSVCMTAQSVIRRKIELLKQGGDSLANEVGEGKDLMSVLLRNHVGTDEVSEENLIGHMSLILLAGTDSTSGTLTRAIEVLSRRTDAQQRLRQELLHATIGANRALSDFDYDAYTSLPYLEAVIKETIRVFPAFYLSPKIAEEDTVLPLSTPIVGTDGQPITELIVPAGTMVWVNIFGLNRDKDIWGPDADEWKPERWLAPLPPSVADAHIPNVYANTMTFIAGPRACIGYQLALTELRIALAHLILAFEFAPSEKEIVWRLGGVASPSVKGSTSAKPELPILISRTSF
ncbi:cytochrome P450 [Earliella scabrosa]|nr:cytochrome P450 [Earliella scabrosa]